MLKCTAAKGASWRGVCWKGGKRIESIFGQSAPPPCLQQWLWTYCNSIHRNVWAILPTVTMVQFTAHLHLQFQNCTALLNRKHTTHTCLGNCPTPTVVVGLYTGQWPLICVILSTGTHYTCGRLRYATIQDKTQWIQMKIWIFEGYLEIELLSSPSSAQWRE